MTLGATLLLHVHPKSVTAAFSTVFIEKCREVACDQCHAQKLRCAKEGHSQVCLRCQRLGKTCTRTRAGHVFTKSLAGRPSKTGRKRRCSTKENSESAVFSEGFRSGVDGSTQIPFSPTDRFDPPPDLSGLWGPDLAFDTLVPYPVDTVPLQDHRPASLSTSSALLNQTDATAAAEYPYLHPSWSWPGEPPLQIPSNLTDPEYSTPENAEEPLASILARAQSPTQNVSRDTGCGLSNLYLALIDTHQELKHDPWASIFQSPRYLRGLLQTSRPDRCITNDYPMVLIFEVGDRFLDVITGLVDPSSLGGGDEGSTPGPVTPQVLLAFPVPPSHQSNYHRPQHTQNSSNSSLRC
ncbi:hypothetical protein BO71DRAFT_484668 [Aspergillus ellipticus CBS 707.79]|uniref:Zn(2)-C6 fungal-type domain-containing protein n=1 Tax=Aspergillus ellipticus CBS 707.79 TaxID=1448320 RepID=A0A319DYV2_9EURO|nr:hypothetical protein BO71DRAFT_484668 [Aspergillus ellipticus CBS 707.79]